MLLQSFFLKVASGQILFVHVHLVYQSRLRHEVSLFLLFKVCVSTIQISTLFLNWWIVHHTTLNLGTLSVNAGVSNASYFIIYIVNLVKQECWHVFQLHAKQPQQFADSVKLDQKEEGTMMCWLKWWGDYSNGRSKHAILSK